VHGDAGIVADDVDGAEGAQRFLGGMLDRGAVRDVGDDSDGAGADGAHFGERRVETVAIDVAEHDRHAVARKGPRQAEPDAGGGSGDDGGFSLELAHPLPRCPRLRFYTVLRMTAEP
jgi:hypothetical protein